MVQGLTCTPEQPSAITSVIDMPRLSARPPRRTLLLGAAAVVAPRAVWAAGNATPLSPMTEGPFYPQPAWRARGPFAGDWDADLTRVTRGGRVRCVFRRS